MNWLKKYRIAVIWAIFLPLGIVIGLLFKHSIGSIYIANVASNAILAIPTFILMLALMVTGYLVAKRYPIDY